MKKITQITVGGIVFSVENDAYIILEKYLNSVQGRFKDKELGEEIIKDIEISIAEKFISKNKSIKKSVSVEDVEKVIEEMGKISDFDDDDKSDVDNRIKYHDEKKENNNNRIKKRLYRDTDDVIIAGVASGIAKYFDLDPVWIRIGFILLCIGSGFGLWIYIILWFVLQKAETTKQKMEMRGEKVNLENVKKYVEEKIEDIPEKTKKNTKTFLVKTIQFFKRIINIFVQFFGMVIILSSSIMIFVFTIILMFSFQPNIVVDADPVTMEFIKNNFSNGLSVIQTISIYLLFIIPTIFILIFGKWLISKKVGNNLFVMFILMFVWVFVSSYIFVTSYNKFDDIEEYIVELNEYRRTHNPIYINVNGEDKDDILKIKFNNGNLIIQDEEEIRKIKL